MAEQQKRHLGRYPDEVRERAVRMVLEHQSEYPSQWKAIESIAKKLDINHETLRVWVRRAETDVGPRPGLTTDERSELTLTTPFRRMTSSFPSNTWRWRKSQQFKSCVSGLRHVQHKLSVFRE